MRDSDKRLDLPLASSSAGCDCCSPQAPAGPTTAAQDADYGLEGLTCGHCAASVEKAVSAVDGVDSAAVELVPGGLSRLRVSGTVADAAVRDAVTSAGYSLRAQ
jgi:copper chaperone CopZ